MKNSKSHGALLDRIATGGVPIFGHFGVHEQRFCGNRVDEPHENISTEKILKGMLPRIVLVHYTWFHLHFSSLSALLSCGRVHHGLETGWF